MRRLISSVAVSVLLGGFTVAAAQLPPEIMVDRYLLQAERFLAEDDYGAALDAMNEIVALQSEHNLTSALRVRLQVCAGCLVSRLERCGD